MRKNKLTQSLNTGELFTLLALQKNDEGCYIPRTLKEILGPDHRRRTFYEYIPGDRTLNIETHDIHITIERRSIEDPEGERARLLEVTAPPRPDPEPDPDEPETIGACIHGGPDDECVSCAEAVRLDESNRI